MTEIKIRQADATHFKLLQILGRDTFYETFAKSNTEANMQSYLTANFTEEKINAELNDPYSHFFIAWDNDAPVGYLKLNSAAAQTERQDPDALEIERIYVKAAYLGKKVGQLLYEKAVGFAQSQNKSSIWLGVWEENSRAIRFYEKNGFVAFNTHIFKMGGEEQTDILMRKVL